LEDVLPLTISRETISNLNLGAYFQCFEGIIVATIGDRYTQSSFNVGGEATSFPFVTDTTLVDCLRIVLVSPFKFVLRFYIRTSECRCRQCRKCQWASAIDFMSFFK
jgi:hypothetical protein